MTTQEKQSKPTIAFSYRDAHGVDDQFELSNWVEVGYYLKGWCVSHDGFRTFRKDRVIQYFDHAARLLSDPHPPKPSIKKEDRLNKADLLQIAFTGFPAVQRADLERRASEAEMDVRQSVTRGLKFLCCGPNAGPTKVSKAMEQHVYIMDQAQFFALLETGELPDSNELSF